MFMSKHGAQQEDNSNEAMRSEERKYIELLKKLGKIGGILELHESEGITQKYKAKHCAREPFDVNHFFNERRRLKGLPPLKPSGNMVNSAENDPRRFTPCKLDFK